METYGHLTLMLIFDEVFSPADTYRSGVVAAVLWTWAMMLYDDSFECRQGHVKTTYHEPISITGMY